MTLCFGERDALRKKQIGFREPIGKLLFIISVISNVVPVGTTGRITDIMQRIQDIKRMTELDLEY